MLRGMAFVFDEDDCSVDSLRMTICILILFITLPIYLIYYSNSISLIFFLIFMSCFFNL